MGKSWFVVAITILANVAAAQMPPLPVPRHDTLRDYQAACSSDAGFVNFRLQVNCIKALVNESSDRYVNKADPRTQLYLLTADKLVDDVAANRVGIANARIELQRTLIEVEAGHEDASKSDAQVADMQRQAKAQAIAQRQADAEARQQQFHDAYSQEQAVNEERAHRAQAADDRVQADRQDQRRAAVQSFINMQAAQQQQLQLQQARAAANQRLQSTTTNCQTRVITPGVASTNCTTN